MSKQIRDNKWIFNKETKSYRQRAYQDAMKKIVEVEAALQDTKDPKELEQLKTRLDYLKNDLNTKSNENVVTSFQNWGIALFVIVPIVLTVIIGIVLLILI